MVTIPGAEPRCGVEIFIDEENDWEVYTEDGMPSAQWEIMVLVTEDGHEVLSW